MVGIGQPENSSFPQGKTDILRDLQHALDMQGIPASLYCDPGYLEAAAITEILQENGWHLGPEIPGEEVSEFDPLRFEPAPYSRPQRKERDLPTILYPPVLNEDGLVVLRGVIW